jgi:oligosaccharide repeat unit polymerase
MSLIIIFVISFLGILLGKFLFKHWFNHLTLYCFIFGGSIFLYEMKLLPYVDIIPFTWFIIISAFLSFLMGILTIIAARNLYKEKPTHIEHSDIMLKIFSDDGKVLKYSILFFSFISLYAAVEFWMVLIRQFGSIPAVFLNAQVIYRLNISGKLSGTTPYIYLVGYVAVFLAGIYTAYKGKFTLLAFIPIFSLILRDLAGSGRAGMLFALMEFIFTIILFRYLLNKDRLRRFKFSKLSIIVVSAILLGLFIASASLVKVSRGVVKAENYSGASRELRQTRDNLILSPSLYLYLSSDVGVLSKYFSSDGEDTPFGQNTFMTAYLFLSKFDIVERPHEFQKGYFIPMWTNTGTYIRELHADFGMPGVLLGSFLLGLLITWFWYKFFEKHSLIALAFLVYLNIIVGFSFFVMATRVIYWSTSLLMLIMFLPILQKLAVYNQRKSVDF